MDYTQFIQPDMLILVPALWLLHGVFTHTPKLPQWSLPYLLGAIGILASSIIVCHNDGWNTMSILAAFLQGIFVTAAAIGSKVMMQQMIKAKQTKENTPTQ